MAKTIENFIFRARQLFELPGTLEIPLQPCVVGSRDKGWTAGRPGFWVQAWVFVPSKDVVEVDDG
jgi:hypothetical protein